MNLLFFFFIKVLFNYSLIQKLLIFDDVDLFLSHNN